MKFKIFSILGIITLFVVGLFLFPFSSFHSPSQKQILANQVRDTAAKKIESEKKLHLIGISGQMLYEIEMLGLNFQYLQEVDLTTARALIVFAVQTLMAEVNENQEIRPYLKNYPFTSKNVEIRIFCYQPDGSNVSLHKLEIISSINGIIKYYPRGSDKFKMEEPIHTETYEEALSIINKKEIEPLIGSNENLKSIGINLLPYPEDFIDEFDVGFKKQLIIFENITEDTMDSCEICRAFSLIPETLDIFIPLKGFMKDPALFMGSTPLIKTKSGMPATLPKNCYISVISEKGFLPGEKISLRVKSPKSDEYNSISFYPRPIRVANSSGEELVCAQLYTSDPTGYLLHFAFNSNNRLVRLYSNSGKEHLNQFVFQDDRIIVNYYPDVIGDTGGLSNLHFTYQNGDTYELDLPWGQELLPYLKGLK